MSGMDLQNIFRDIEEKKKIGLIGEKEQILMPGDTYKGSKLRGSKIMWCPFCNLMLPAQFLRLEDKSTEQSMGYSCSHCLKPLVAITRNKFTGKIVKRYSAPGYRFTG
jgi:hypothetical protein